MHRQAIRNDLNAVNRRTHAERVILLFIGSGVIYALLWVSRTWINERSTGLNNTDTTSDLLSGICRLGNKGNTIGLCTSNQGWFRLRVRDCRSQVNGVDPSYCTSDHIFSPAFLIKSSYAGSVSHSRYPSGLIYQ